MRSDRVGRSGRAGQVSAGGQSRGGSVGRSVPMQHFLAPKIEMPGRAVGWSGVGQDRVGQSGRGSAQRAVGWRSVGKRVGRSVGADARCYLVRNIIHKVCKTQCAESAPWERPAIYHIVITRPHSSLARSPARRSGSARAFSCTQRSPAPLLCPPRTALPLRSHVLCTQHSILRQLSTGSSACPPLHRTVQ